MKLRGKILVAALLLGGGTAVAALAPNTIVYIKAKNTKLLKKADATSDVVEVLQPGAEVKWQKAEGKEFHVVNADGKTGYVFFSNLSMQKPVQEYAKGSGAVDPRAFASSGAATKALGDGAIEYGSKKLNNEDAVRAVLAMEAIAQQTSIEDVAAHVKTAGLVPAVGTEGGK